MVPRGRDRKMFKLDQERCFNKMEASVSEKAKSEFKKPPYSSYHPKAQKPHLMREDL